MPGLVPGIHVLASRKQGVDGRDKPGHGDKDIVEGGMGGKTSGSASITGPRAR